MVEYRPTEKGIEVDLSLHVSDRRALCVWEGITTLLSRNPDTRSRGRKTHTSTMQKLVQQVQNGEGKEKIYPMCVSYI